MTDSRAEERVRMLARRDRFAALTGAEFVSGGAGRAVLRMRVQRHHLNFYDTCHGAAIFALADAAFGLASNSHGQVAVALDVHLTFPTAAREGDVLTATAEELTRTRRTGTYRIEVRRQDDALVSQFTGTVYVTGKPVE